MAEGAPPLFRIERHMAHPQISQYRWRLSPAMKTGEQP
jgi:hypothetical protein